MGSTTDSLISTSGNLLAVVQTFTEITEGRYHIQIGMVSPDSTDYFYRFSTVGDGTFDVWSSDQYTFSSDMASDSNFVFPTVLEFPDIAHYKYPDQDISIVSDWACSDKVITVANYKNQKRYVATSFCCSECHTPLCNTRRPKDGRWFSCVDHHFISNVDRMRCNASKKPKPTQESVFHLTNELSKAKKSHKVIRS